MYEKINNVDQIKGLYTEQSMLISDVMPRAKTTDSTGRQKIASKKIKKSPQLMAKVETLTLTITLLKKQSDATQC